MIHQESNSDNVILNNKSSCNSCTNNTTLYNPGENDIVSPVHNIHEDCIDILPDIKTYDLLIILEISMIH